MISLSTDGLESIYDSDILAQPSEIQESIDVPSMEDLMVITSNVNTEGDAEWVNSEATQNRVFQLEVLLLEANECEPLSPIISTQPLPNEKKQPEKLNDKDLQQSSSKCIITPTTALNKKFDVTSRRNLKSTKHPALIANIPRKTLFDELTEAKLEIVKIQKGLLEAEINEKSKVWEFDENECKKEAKRREEENKRRGEEHKWKEKEAKRREEEDKRREEEDKRREEEHKWKEEEAKRKEKEHKWKEKEHKLKLGKLKQELYK